MKNTIKINRTIQGLSQDQLAKEVEVSRQTINAIENNKYFPSLELGLKLFLNDLYFIHHQIC